MVELGQWLRETRETKGLSLAQVEGATRIRQKYLAALESGEPEELPGDVPTRGFLRNYATFLGLDADEAVRRLGKPRAEVMQIAKVAEQAMGPRAVDYRPIEVELHHESPFTARWLAIGLLIGIALVALVLGVWAWRTNPQLLSGLLAPLSTATPTSTATAPANTTAPTATPDIYRITATPTAGIFLLPTPTPTATPISTAAPTPTMTAPVTEMEVVVRAVQRAWVRVLADEQVVLEKVLEAGSEQRWQIQYSFVLRTGNAGGVEVTINGEAQGALGSLGGIEECTWTLADGLVSRRCGNDGDSTVTSSVTVTATSMTPSPTSVTGASTPAATATPGRTPTPGQSSRLMPQGNPAHPCAPLPNEIMSTLC
ncbi:MAG: RodZ domain-containing protein [Anaerolineae bacterium]